MSSSVTSTPIKTMTPPINPHQQHSASTHSTPVRSPQPPAQHSISTSSLLPVNDLDVIQEMIACSADRLEGLRTQCSTSNTLTQIEIRSLETKLLKMFSDLLLTKGKLNERIPASGLPRTSGNELRQWLRVVGLSLETINACLTRLSTLEQLMDLGDLELKDLLQYNPARRDEEVRRLCRAMENLKKCKELLAKSHQLDGSGGGGGGGGGGREQLKCIIEKLHWDSWDRHQQQHHHRGSMGNIEETSSPRVQRHMTKQINKQQHANLNSSLTASGSNASTHSSSSSRQSPANDAFRNNTSYASSSSATDDSSNNTTHNSSQLQNSNLTLTLTPSPPNSPFTPTSTSTSFSQFCGGSLNGTPQKHKNAGTPPPMKKHYTALNQQQPPLTPEHHIPIPLSKSKSNESQFHDNSYSSAASTVISSPSSMVNNVAGAKTNAAGGQQQRSRLNTDPSPDSHSSASSDLYVDSTSAGNQNQQNNNSLQVPPPMSPCTTTTIVNLSMSHNINHRFTMLIRRSTCDFCQKAMFIGRKCKECKYRCHTDCAPDVPPSCCLPPEFIEEFKNTIENQVGSYHHHIASAAATQPGSQQQQQQSPNTNTLGKQRKVAALAAAAASSRHQKHGSTASSQTMASIAGMGIHAADSSSPGSSCNSSSPSSPALFNLQHQHSSSGEMLGGGSVGGGGGGGSLGGGTLMSSSAGGSSTTSSNVLSTPSSYHNNKNASQFHFPDVTITKNCNNPAGSTTETILSAAQSLNCSSSPQHEYGGAGAGTDLSKSRNNSSEALLSTSTTSCNSVISHTAQQAVVSSVITQSSSSSSSTSTHTSIITSSANIVNSGPAPFFQRKLSSAGVDKRGNFTELSDTHKSNDSDKTVSLSGSTSASTDSDRTPVRLDSTEDGDSGNWPRQNSLSLKEWDIPYSDLQMLEQIGQGRFGTVHRALWHGSVAVKLFKEDYMDNENMLEAFKVEVANFKKTRHENLVLFMGACMNPPYLAIVTSLCKGNTLYTHIHARREKFVINKTTLIAQQITQGMGYLHARGIIHKDLRTKNIFLENGKVIITDFGLFSSTKLLYCVDKGLGIPSNWLCYLAPELMRCLMPSKPISEILPFSMASDVYSFGTVWYELLCGEFPFKLQPPESIIWQVGRGMKQTLANLQTTRDVKDILMLCWHYDYREGDRPDFPKLLTLFERLPKKRLARSPSHPVQLSRSAEAIF